MSNTLTNHFSKEDRYIQIAQPVKHIVGRHLPSTANYRLCFDIMMDITAASRKCQVIMIACTSCRLFTMTFGHPSTTERCQHCGLAVYLMFNEKHDESYQQEAKLIERRDGRMVGEVETRQVQKVQVTFTKIPLSRSITESPVATSDISELIWRCQ